MKWLLFLVLVVLIGGNDGRDTAGVPQLLEVDIEARGQVLPEVWRSGGLRSWRQVDGTPDWISHGGFDSGVPLRVAGEGVVVEAEFIRGRPDVVSPRIAAPPEGAVDGLYGLGPAVIQATDVAYYGQHSFLFALRERVVLLLGSNDAAIWRNMITQAVEHFLPLQGQFCLSSLDTQVWHQLGDSASRLLRMRLPDVFGVSALAEILRVLNKARVAAEAFDHQLNSLGFCLGKDQSKVESTFPIHSSPDLTQRDAAIRVNDASQVSQNTPIHDSSVIYQGEDVNGELFDISIYCCKNDPGGAYCGTTATGTQVRPGVVACDPAYLSGDPQNPQAFIVAGERFVCEDTGSAVHGKHLDIWFYDCGTQEDPAPGTGWGWLQRELGSDRAIVEVIH